MCQSFKVILQSSFLNTETSAYVRIGKPGSLGREVAKLLKERNFLSKTSNYSILLTTMRVRMCNSPHHRQGLNIRLQYGIVCLTAKLGYDK